MNYTPKVSLFGVVAVAVASLALGCNAAEDGETDAETIGEESSAVVASGLVGEYFNNIDFTGTKVTRTDSKVDFNWGSGAPMSSMGANTFSVRWTGKVQAKYSEQYRFYTVSDDGVRLWVNGQQLVNNWTNHGATENSGTITLTAGQKYDIKMEYYENSGSAVARLRWSSPSQLKQIVPASQLSNGDDTTPPPPPGGGPTIAGCQVFPSDNHWNQDISGASVDAKSNDYINYIMANGGDFMHPDFGSYAGYGIPYVVVPGTQTKVPMSFDYDDESDPGPYPIPPNPPIEGGASSTGDRHILVIDQDNCKLYETWDSHFVNPGWHCGAGAVWDLNSNALRPAGWTSADAAGMPVLAGLVRYEEAVTAGEIKHALRFTVAKTQRAYVHPATHRASTITDPNAPPMGVRLRLKASFDISGYAGASKVILTALKKYGMFLADNGSNWYVSGTSHPSFDDDDLNQLKSVSGSNFEVITTGPLHY